MGKIATVRYTVKNKCFGKKIRFAIVADLHSREYTEIDSIIDILKREMPDYILMPGDIFERLDGTGAEHKRAGLELLSKSSGIAPVIYSIGNHENGGIASWNAIKWLSIDSIPKYFDEKDLDLIRDTGAVMLDDSFTCIDGIAFGGLSSGLINKGRRPNLEWLDGFCDCKCPKVLLCHHPEYYKKYLRGRDIDLVISGHAHGGQWRIFGQGVFAPGQGIFPRYTSGVHHGKLVISKGLKPSRRIPRIFNRPEVVIVEIDN